MDLEQAMKICKEENIFKSAVKYFASNIKNVNSSFFTAEKRWVWDKEVLALSFFGTKYQIELEI